MAAGLGLSQYHEAPKTEPLSLATVIHSRTWDNANILCYAFSKPKQSSAPGAATRGTPSLRLHEQHDPKVLFALGSEVQKVPILPVPLLAHSAIRGKQTGGTKLLP